MDIEITCFPGFLQHLKLPDEVHCVGWPPCLSSRKGYACQAIMEYFCLHKPLTAPKCFKFHSASSGVTTNVFRNNMPLLAQTAAFGVSYCPTVACTTPSDSCKFLLDNDCHKIDHCNNTPWVNIR